MSDRLVLWSVLGVALLISVVTDLVSRRIPDVVTYPTAIIALGFRFFREGVGDLEHGLVSGAVAGLSAGALFSILALRKRFGWGDVKLMLAAGCVLGYPLTMAALIFVSLAGALQAIVTLMWKGTVWTTLAGAMRRTGQKLRLVKSKPEDKPEPDYIPYGVAIALGCFWAMWWDRKG